MSPALLASFGGLVNHHQITMTKLQQTSFFTAISTRLAKKPSHVLTGTRLLAPHASAIRVAVKLGATHEDIAQSLSVMPNSPFGKGYYSLAKSTRKMYVAQACNELGITRRAKRSAWS